LAHLNEVTRSIPQVFKEVSLRYWDEKQALRRKELGIWRSYTWKDYYENTKYFACGLAALGFEPGDRVAIIGDNAPQWLYAMFGAMSLKGASTGASPQGLPAEIEYCINHSESKFVVLEDQEQVDKYLEIKTNCPRVVKAIYWDTKGMKSYDEPTLMSFERLQALGREYEERHPGFFETSIDSTDVDDVCAINYTSGTTGLPKGALYSSRTLLTYSLSSDAAEMVLEDDELFSIIPLWTIGDLTATFLVAIRTGAAVSFPEKPETLPVDLREISPARQVVAPRWLEAQISQTQVGIIKTTALKRLAYKLLMPIGTGMARYLSRNLKPPLWLRLVYVPADLLLFRPLRDYLGYTKTRTLICTGAAVSSDVFSFFLAIGLRVLNGYGMAEVGIVSLHNRDDIDPETAGVPVPGALIRISPEGEIQVKPPSSMLGYHNNPEATRKFTGDEGWLNTEDAGYIDDKGHLVCLDRMKEMMRLSDGSLFSPQYLEGKVKFSPYVINAVIVGHNRPFVAGLIIMDFANVSTWAESNRIPYTTYTDLSQRPETRDLIKESLAVLNRRLPENHRIKKFLILHKELDADDAEVTRTMKLRRSFVTEKYSDLIEALYQDKKEVQATAEVKYRDGKVRRLETEVKIISIEEEDEGL